MSKEAGNAPDLKYFYKGLHTIVAKIKRLPTHLKMTGVTSEVRSDKSLTLMTFNIQHSTNGPMDQWTNVLMDQWTNGQMNQ